MHQTRPAIQKRGRTQEDISEHSPRRALIVPARHIFKHTHTHTHVHTRTHTYTHTPGLLCKTRRRLHTQQGQKKKKDAQHHERNSTRIVSTSAHVVAPQDAAACRLIGPATRHQDASRSIISNRSSMTHSRRVS